MPSPFDYINTITQSKKYILEDEKDYPDYMVNRGLSLFPDTVFFANEINLLPQLPSKLKYDYLINTVEPRKRYSKWPKKKEDEDLKILMMYYGFNMSKARAALKILSTSQIKTIKDRLDEGG